MIHFIPTFKGATVMMGIVASGGGLGILADALGPETHITLGTAVGIGTVVVLGAWYLARWMQKVTDRLKVIERELGIKKRKDDE